MDSAAEMLLQLVQMLDILSCVAAPEDFPLLRSSAALRNPNFACSNRSARAVVSSVVRFLTIQGTFGPGYDVFKSFG